MTRSAPEPEEPWWDDDVSPSDDDKPAQARRTEIAFGGVMLLRSFTLWILLFTGVFVWFVGWPIFRWHRVRAEALVAWCDWNLMAVWQRVLLRPLFPDPVEWCPVSSMATIEHRVDWADSA